MVKNQVEIDIADTLLEVPLEFLIGRKQFYIYPLTLGKSFVVERLMNRIGIAKFKDDNLSNFMLLATVSSKRADFIKLIAYYTLPKDECLDVNKVAGRVKELRKIKDHQIAALVSIIISSDRTSEIMEHYKFDDEKKRLDKVMKAKKADGNTVIFGGHSVWGSVIDFLAERYGWSLQYILWGISYTNLSMLMEDHVRSVYLTDEELKQANLPKDNILIKADDKDALQDFISTQNWR